MHVADKVYGVSHTNRLSRIDTITRDDALTFLARRGAGRERVGVAVTERGCLFDAAAAAAAAAGGPGAAATMRASAPPSSHSPRPCSRCPRARPLPSPPCSEEKRAAAAQRAAADATAAAARARKGKAPAQPLPADEEALDEEMMDEDDE